MAQKAHRPTDETRQQVEKMSACGITQMQIASVLDINDKTLRKHYSNELDNAKCRATVAVSQSLYERALGDGPGAVTAAIFWLKTRAGWRLNDHVEIDIPQPIVYRMRRDLHTRRAGKSH